MDARHIEAAASQAGVSYGEALGKIAAMPQTPAERQEARRKRLLMDGITEVRGIFLHESQHAELKEYAKKMAKRHKPEEKKE